MSSKVITLNRVLEETESLDIDDREYLLDILSKRLIEFKRKEISKRAKEALKACREGNVKSGDLNDLWKDLHDWGSLQPFIVFRIDLKFIRLVKKISKNHSAT